MPCKAEYVERWGYTVVDSDGVLPRLELAAEACMFMEKEDRSVQGEKYEGVLHTDGKHGNLGSLTGQLFEAELETEWRKRKLKFLVNQQAPQVFDDELGYSCNLN